MRRPTAGRVRPGVLGRVLRTGALAAAAAAPLVTMLVFFAVSARRAPARAAADRPSRMAPARCAGPE
jgi:hypothetical protein